jgi:hypothetical protein
MAARTFPSPAVVREITSNRYFLSCVYRAAGALDLEALLEVNDESFQTYDALRYEHGDKRQEDDDEDETGDDDEDEDEDDVPEFDQLMDESADDDDDDEAADDDTDDADGEVVEQRLTIPLYLPRGFVWEVVHFDNGEDAGVVHQIRAPGADPARFATLDAHPTGHAMSWSEAERLIHALAADPRNRAANVVAVAPLLLWSAVGVRETDDRDAIRARLAEAWRHTGVVSPDVADQIALESSRRRATKLASSAQPESFKQLLAALAA